VTAFDAYAEAEARRTLGLVDPDDTSDDPDEIYDAVVTDDVDDEVERLTQAECLLALARAIPLLALRATERGGLVLSVGLDNSRREIYSPDQAREAAGAMRTMALDDLAAIRDARLEAEDEGAQALYIC
jgi:hypothetical protein